MPQQKTNEISLRLRAHVPAVLFGQTRGWKFFDGPSGTQMVDGCLDAMRDYMLTGVANRKEIAPTGDQTEEIIGRARQEFQRFLNAPGYRVVFGQNMTSLAFAFAHAIARHRAREGSSILISELEHFGNVDPLGAELRRSRSRSRVPPGGPGYVPARRRRHGQGVLRPERRSGGGNARRKRDRHCARRGQDRRSGA